jgi:glycosyltransferase involved in cell wall biosynthesis
LKGSPNYNKLAEAFAQRLSISILSERLGERVMVDPVPISVVIPAFNSEDFIGDAISSVHAQSVPVSEIIVVDDGSSDRTAAVAETLGAFVIRQANKGVSVARNVGIRAATKPWIALLDQDDLWEPKKIEYQWAGLQTYPDAGILSCNMTWFEDSSIRTDSSPVEIALRQNLHQQQTENPSFRHFPRLQQELPLSRMYDNPSSVLLRRDLLLSVGGFDESLHQNEDLECFLRLVRHCPLVIVDRILVHHRTHGKNRSQDSLEAGMSYLRIVDMLRAQPERYPLGAAQVYGKHSWSMMIHIGCTRLREGRVREARALFTRSLKQIYSHRAVFLWCLTFLRPKVFKYLLNRWIG